VGKLRGFGLSNTIGRAAAGDDVRTVMNTLLFEGQICGGIAQGVGQVLMEDIRFDPASGQLLTGLFMDYAMPRAGDLSARNQIE
jgi:aerobic carbon-monoxide dehydrogenase large subunit